MTSFHSPDGTVDVPKRKGEGWLASYGDRIMWSYYDGSQWSNEVSIGSQRMYGYASLAARAERLVMVHPSSIDDHVSSWPDFSTDVYGEYFQ